MQQPPLIHRIPDACARLGIGRTTLHHMIKRGEIKPIKLGGRVVIPEEELQRIVSERLNAAKAAA